MIIVEVVMLLTFCGTVFLYRKSSSLSVAARKRLIDILCQAVQLLSTLLTEYSSTNSAATATTTSNSNNSNSAHPVVVVVSQSFRDAFACHLYMLYTIMFFQESEAKAQKSLPTTITSTMTTTTSKSKQSSSKSKSNSKSKHSTSSSKHTESAIFQTSRTQCAQTMLIAVQSMSNHRSILWKRSVPEESIVSLPCRIAYPMLELATGVMGNKLANGTIALEMLAWTVRSCPELLLGTVVAALVDLLHSFEHMAPLVAQLCSKVHSIPLPTQQHHVVPSSSTSSSTNPLALELMKEIGNLEVGPSNDATSGKASGIRTIAPFISELAALEPAFVRDQFSLVLPHLQSDSYNLRSCEQCNS